MLSRWRRRSKTFFGHPRVSKEISKRILDRLNIDNKDVYIIENHDSIIDTNNIKDRNTEIKRLKAQYADAYAHSPSTLQKRILRLNSIKDLI